MITTGLDLVELLTNGEDITAHCALCNDAPIETWRGYVLANQVVHAWEQHKRVAHAAPGLGGPR